MNWHGGDDELYLNLIAVYWLNIPPVKRSIHFEKARYEPFYVPLDW